MKRLFSRLTGKEKGWRFEKEDLAEIPEDLRNPARGWYQIHTFSAEEEPDFEAQRWCLDRQDTLALVLIDIGAFRKKPLDDNALGRICRILRFFGDNGYGCILRVVYDREGKALFCEPPDFAQVLAHMGQIASVMEACGDVIFIFQGMLLGNWGEMHGSRFLNEGRMLQLTEILRGKRKAQTYLAVRRPVHWRILHRGQRQGALDGADGMGIFDDGIFGSASNLGTFSEEEKKGKAWDQPWSRDEELEFEQELGGLAPLGGEAVYHSGFIKTLTPGQVIDTLRRMQVTYLNKAYDTRILDLFKGWEYPGAGAWAGKSVYDYVGAHLGYRFLVRSVQVTRIKHKENLYRACVAVENTGFGGFYQEAGLSLEYTDIYGKRRAAVLESRMKGWKSGEIRKLSCTVEAGGGAFYLTAKRKADNEGIHFANGPEDEGKTVLGYLHTEY